MKSDGEKSLRPLSPADLAAMALGATLLLVISWIRSQGTIFWSDEVMGWMVIQEHNFASLLRSWYIGSDSSGIFFYLIGRQWLHLFGDTATSLRMFSAAGVAVAFVFTWATARRYFNFSVVAASVLTTMLLNKVLLWQLANARTYGIFLAAIAIMTYVFVRSEPVDNRPTSNAMAVAVFAAHALLLGSQFLGIAYACIFLAAMFGRDLYMKRLQWQLYLSAGAAWIIMLTISLRNLQATSAVGKPVFWTVRPRWLYLLWGFFDMSRPVTTLLVLVSLVYAVVLLWRWKSDPVLLRRVVSGKTSFYFLLAAFAATPIAFFVVSRLTTSIYADRYLLPVALGDALFLCEAVSGILLLIPFPKAARGIAAIAALALFVVTVRNDLQANSIYPQKDYTGTLARQLPSALPIVTPDASLFADMVFNRNNQFHLLMPIDPEYMFRPEAGGSVSGAHQMDNWKTVGYFANQIQPVDQILQQNRKFVAVVDEPHTSWFQARVKDNPEFVVSNLGEFQAPASLYQLWLVEHR